MTSKMGENIQREWDEEILAIELWEALQLRKQDHAAAIVALTNLAERGSALAMMYLGHYYVRFGNRDQMAQGEDWLAQSAKAGSIEGRFQLALHHERQGAWANAIVELKTLEKHGYPPASYQLALLRYKGDLAHRSLQDAVAHLKIAIDAEHLPSIRLLSQICRKERLGLSAAIASYWLHLRMMPTLVRCIWTNPNSDKLRPFGPDHRSTSKWA